LPLGGIMTHELGWNSPFYLVGAAGTVWFAGWIFLCYNSPDEHPRISAEELEYLKANVRSNRLTKLPSAPYLEIIKTRGFWAIQLSLLGSAWGNFTLMTSTPLYLNNIQHFSLSEVSMN
jgi:predicted MFS family arabinose efflux permease